MARISCQCGRALSNVSCPSDDLLQVFGEHAIIDAIHHSKSLFELCCDQMTEHREFWYCHDCGRVYIERGGIEGGYCESVYRPDQAMVCPAYLMVSTWNHLYVFTDKEVDQATEKDIHLSLKEFIQNRKRDSVISEDMSQVFCYDAYTHRPLCAYVRV